MATYIDLVQLIWTRHKLALRHSALDFNHSLQTRGRPFGFGTGITIKSPDDQGVLTTADWAVMIAAQAGPQWSFVESFRDEARLYRGLSRASTTGQWATR